MINDKGAIIILSILAVAAIFIYLPKKYWLPAIIISPIPPIP